MKKEFPFTMTRVIQRYINEMILFYNKGQSYLEKGEKIQAICVIQTYTEEEAEWFTENFEKNRGAFIRYLEKIEAIEFFKEACDKKIESHYVQGTGEQVLHHEEMRLKILNIKPIRQFQTNGGELKKITPEENILVRERYIICDEQGDFFYGKSRTKINFENHELEYYRIFLAIYKVSEGDGLAKYKNIKQYLRKAFGAKSNVGKIDTVAIRNAVYNSIEHRADELRFPLSEGGKPTLEYKKNGGITFNNPPISRK
jgi:hypothetical protein